MSRAASGGLPIPKVERPQSLSAIVIAQLRQLIITGRLELGQQISEITIAEQLGVSRTPVREAFLTLETERLLRVHRQRGTFVFDYDARELREICELRAVLETGAFRIALQRDRPRLVTSLAEQVAAAKVAATSGIDAYQTADTAFHDALVRSSDNRELIEGYARISGRIRAVRYRLMRTPQQIAKSCREHSAVASLLKHGKDAEAEAALVKHVYNGYQAFIAATVGDARG
ncbi:GntR family transcriptional regulator [Marinivivus vitaminiproducens]|uniref:GntR family transcriptional regulator n=1 Tax=Marinivivus vitaminiproducens TaxID=3035935 RepID=UPI002799B203|nr:GntR family transcriptional regulator [Geminicoccaceae bacterium SCSIO 64248]